MKLLFVTPHIKWPLTHGGHIRRWNILQGLLSIGPVDVIACGGLAHGHQDGAYEGCKNVYYLGPDLFDETLAQRRRRESNLGRSWTVMTSSLPQTFIKGDMNSARGFFRDVISRNDYSLIWIETLRCDTLLNISRTVRHVTRVLDGDDFSWVRDLGILRNTEAYGTKFFEYVDIIKLRRLELKCAKNYSCVIRCSEEDARLQGGNNVTVIPNGTDVPEVANRNPESRILFVGLLSYAPNWIGVEWFIRSVWPSIFKEIPNARFDVVGKDPSDEILSANGKNGITVHGFVNDLTKFYESATVSVVPLHAGGGTRLKILESLGRGVPVISTTVGAYGIPLTESHGLIRSDGASSFSRECIKALQEGTDEIQRAAQSGRLAISEAFDWKILRRGVADVARRLLIERVLPSTE